MKKKIAILLSVALIALSGCNGGETQTTTTTAGSTTTTATTEAPSEEATYQLTKENVKILGRTYAAPDGVLWLAHSASAVEFTFTGTNASITVVGDSGATSANADSQARYAVYVNGERTIDAQVNEAEKELELFASDEDAETTIKIVKLSESANSIFGLKNLKVESKGGIKPTENKELMIEFIGDSITCGYGVDDEVKEHHFSTSTEDATKAYAYKAAMLLDADYSLVSYSGHGIISGYTGTGKKQTGQLLPKLYNFLGNCYNTADGTSMKSVMWNFETYTPDIIVINLGTNDNSYVKSDAEKTQEFKDGYYAFIEQVREKNPDAAIICALGTMGGELARAINETVDSYNTATNDNNVYFLKLPTQVASDGYAADWHPTEASHEKAAQKLVDFINENNLGK